MVFPPLPQNNICNSCVRKGELGAKCDLSMDKALVEQVPTHRGWTQHVGWWADRASLYMASNDPGPETMQGVQTGAGESRAGNGTGDKATECAWGAHPGNKLSTVCVQINSE